MSNTETSPNPHADVRLMRWFAFSGAAAIGVFSVAMALVLGEFLASRMLARDAAVSREFVQSIVVTQRVARAFEGPDERSGAAFVEFVAHMAVMPDVLRANVYAADRTVLWSSDAALIGRRFVDNEELEEALAGQVVVHQTHGPGNTPTKAELQSLRVRSDDFVENYLPVYAEGGGKPVGVVELYRNPVALFEAIRSGRQLMWWSAAAGGLFLFATLGWFVRRAEKALREQRARLVEAEALAIVGELSAAVAHSIRNPLGSIRSSAELQRELEPGTQAAMDDIMRGVDRIDRLVSTLLSYAADPAEHEAHVSDMRSLAIMRDTQCPVVFDATHSVQLPGGLGKSSGGQRQFVPILARAAVAVGVSGVFMETHPNPEKALSDGPNAWPLNVMGELLETLIMLDRAVKSREFIENKI